MAAVVGEKDEKLEAEPGATKPVEMLEPGKNIRPIMTLEQARQLIQTLYGLEVVEIRDMVSYDDKNYRVKVSAEHSNPHMTELWPPGYTLKVLNSMDSKKTHVEAEHQAQAILHKAGIACPQPVQNVHGALTSIEKITYQTEDPTWAQNNADENGDPPHGFHLVRLLTFLPGEIFVNVPYTPNLLHQAGRHIANIEKALIGWSHEAVSSFRSMWALSSVPKLKDFLYAVTDDTKRALATHVIEGFETEIVPKANTFRKGVIHGDYNEQNLVVEPSGNRSRDSPHEEHDIVGVIDFGDMSETYYVYEVGITIMYMMVESKVVDALDVGGHVLAGYCDVMPLPAHEFDALKTCVAGRFAQSLVMGAYSYSQDPGNEYLIVTAARGWGILQRLWDTPKDELYARWRRVMETYKAKS